MKTIKVQKNTDIDTINKALKLCTGKTTIYVSKGIYHEKIKIINDDITIIGEDVNETIITNNDYAKKIFSDGLEYNTFRTYTLLIKANNVKLENLTVNNASGTGLIYGQSVALATIGNNIKITNCIFDSFQDTVFVGPLPKDLIERYQNFLPNDELIYNKPHKVFFNNSKIIGDVDFIFGAGSGIFIDCEITSRERNGYVCAPATEIDDDEGFVFYNCKFTKLNKETSVYLARPWRDFGKATFIDCLYDNHILDVGFDKWNDTNRDKTCRFYEYNGKYFDNHKFNRIYFCKELDINTVKQIIVSNQI